jgi:hypothetical protein
VHSGRAADLSAAEIPGRGGSTAGGPSHSFTVTRSFDATTGVRGLFDVLVPAEGATFFVVHVAAHRRVRLDLGDADAGATGTDRVAEPAPGTPVDLPRGGAPSDAEVAALHDAAHQACFLANTVRGAVVVRPGGGG